MTDIQAIERYQYLLDNVLFIQELLEADVIQIQGTVEKVDKRILVLLLTTKNNLDDCAQYYSIESLKSIFMVDDNEEYQKELQSISIDEKHEMVKNLLEIAFKTATKEEMVELETYYQINRTMLTKPNNKKEVIKWKTY